MPDTQKEEFDFIKEKIKDKPINKRRLARQVLKTAVLGVVFGAAASLTFLFVYPFLEGRVRKPNEQVFSFPKDNEAVDMPTEQTGTEEETEQEKGGTPEPDTQIIEVPRDMEPEDYQKLQHKLYAVGIRTNQSIVTVTGVKSDTDWFNTPYETEGQACGIVIAKNKDELLVMTEQKVVRDASTVTITFKNGLIAEAEVKGSDSNTGIAVLSVPLSEVREITVNTVEPVVLGNSYQVSQGDVVIAVGSPLGSNYSILTGNITSTSNVVSAYDSNFTVFTTDIVGSTNGNGALLNLEGDVIGLITQDYNGKEGTLTALSISELKEILERLSNGKNIGYLGLKVSTVTNEIQTEYELPRGVYIKYVEMDSPALAAGLQNGDVIVGINGEEILTTDQYEQLVRKMENGSAARITIMRQGNEGYTKLVCMAEVGCL